MSKKKHARFGPSSLDNLSRCIRFKYQETPGLDDAASEGTMMHKALETGNMAGLDEEQVQAVTAVRDYVSSLLASEGGPDKWDRYDEMRVELADLTFGTADCVLVHKSARVAHIIDAKFGRLSADHSFQVRTYGAAMAEMLSTNGVPEGRACHLDTIHCHVVAPRQGLVETETHIAQDLWESVRKEIGELYERIDNPFNPPTPHEDVCNKCAWASQCPAMGRMAVATAPGLGLPLPATFRPEAMISTRDRAIAQVLAEALITWADQVKKSNSQFVVEGGELPGYRLVTRGTGLRIASEDTPLAIQVLEENGIPRDLVLGACRLTLGSLATALAELQGILTGEAKERLQTILGPLASEGVSQYLQKTKRQPNEEQLRHLLAMPL